MKSHDPERKIENWQFLTEVIMADKILKTEKANWDLTSHEIRC